MCSCPKPIKSPASDLTPSPRFLQHTLPSREILHLGKGSFRGLFYPHPISEWRSSQSLAVQIYNVWSLCFQPAISYTSLLFSHLPPYCVFKMPGRPQGLCTCCLLCQKQCSQISVTVTPWLPSGVSSNGTFQCGLTLNQSHFCFHSALSLFPTLFFFIALVTIDVLSILFIYFIVCHPSSFKGKLYKGRDFVPFCVRRT